MAPLPQISFIILNLPCKTQRPISILQYYIWGVIDILNLGSTAETVSNSILHIANQCKNYGVKDVSVSSATCTTLHNSNNFVLYLNNNHFLIKQPNRQILS